MKKLDLQAIKKITFGAERITDEGNAISFERMKSQTIHDFIEADWIKEDYEKRCHATANICFDFYTDSQTIIIKYSDVFSASSRPFWYIDVLVNNNIVAHHGEEFFSKTNGVLKIELYETPARVTICLPCLYKLKIKEISILDHCYIEPVKKNCIFLFYGDSITQGYDVRLPSLSYSSIVGRAFNAEVKNLAVGGSFYDPKILSQKYDADIVFIAYGTNDWAHKPFEQICHDSSQFYESVYNLYKGKRVIILLPVYRMDFQLEKEYGNDFIRTREMLKNNASKYNFEVLDTINWLVKDEISYSDKHLHPNEFGNMQIANHLIEYLKS